MQGIYDIGTIAKVASDSPARHRTITAPRHGRKPNKWCGANAVSALTGCTTDLPALIVARARYAPSGPIGARDIANVRGTYLWEIQHVLRVLGFNIVRDRSWDGQTFARLCDDRTREPNTAYLVAAAHHWMVVQGAWFSDNQLGLLRCSDAHKRRGIVLDAHRVVRERIVDDAAVARFYRNA